MPDHQTNCAHCGAIGATVNDGLHLCIGFGVQYQIYAPHTIKSVTPMSDGTLEVVRQYPSNITFTTNPPRPAPDRVVKEIYGAKDGKVVLLRTIEGKHFPAERVPERVEFPE